MCLHDWTNISLSVRNSTPIIAKICIRLDIILPVRKIWIACFLRLFVAFLRKNDFDVATPTARTALRQVTC